MKKIKIHKFGSGIDWLFIVPSIMFAIIGVVELFKDSESLLFAISLTFSGILNVILLGRMLVIPNSIWWNNKGLNIKLGNWYPQNISFYDVQSYSFDNDKLIIKSSQSDNLSFDISSYKKENFRRESGASLQ